jgi:hypothetical protein
MLILVTFPRRVGEIVGIDIREVSGGIFLKFSLLFRQETGQGDKVGLNLRARVDREAVAVGTVSVAYHCDCWGEEVVDVGRV